MSGEWRLRRDIERFRTFLDNLESDMISRFGEQGNLLDLFYGKADVDGLLRDMKADVDGLLRDTKAEMLDLVYPIGAIYMSVNPTDPSLLFGGTWVQLEDRFLLGAGVTYTAGDVDGEANHTLTTNEMPAHTHKQNQWSIIVSSGGNTGTNGLPTGTLVNSIRDDRQSNTRVTEGTGGGQAHNNMPPYLVVYMWKRIEPEPETPIEEEITEENNDDN